jgi:hypothetical protein
MLQGRCTCQKMYQMLREVDETNREFCLFVGITLSSASIHVHGEIRGQTSKLRALHIGHLSTQRWRVLFHVVVECL